MRSLSEALAAAVGREVATLAHAFVLTRTDGTVLGFTDHDRTLVVDGVTCEPGSGLERSAATARSDLSAGEEEVRGALTSDRITDADLAAGLYDGATVAVWLVDWRDTARAVRLRVGTIGDVTRRNGAFTAEVRGPAAALDRPSGRVFARTCDAAFGDARCGVSRAAWTTAATVAATDGAGRLRLDGADALDAGLLAGGTLAVTGGAAAGADRTVVSHRVDGTGVWVTLFPDLAALPAAGDAVTVTAGCDKLHATCRDRFSNALNFRGFPHIPGTDYAITVGGSDDDAAGEPMVTG